MDIQQDEIKEALQNNNVSFAVERIKTHLENENKIPLHIAVTGETGSGKSTFVNAFRGLGDSDDGAAPTGCVETTMKPTPYVHPNYPNVTLWDLPGVGTTNYPADKYLEKVGFDKFDFFFIISGYCFTENDVKLAQQIKKMGKKFYFVRSKIDQDLYNERRKKDFNEERTLANIRENCIQGLQRQGFEAPQVFLVSSFDLHLYDFQLLEETFERELLEHKRNALLLTMPNFARMSMDIQLDEIKEALQNNNQALAVEMIKTHLEKEKNIPLNIAVTGESGSGKSTFVNAFRGIKNNSKGAAPTGCVETTMKPTPYVHPNYPNVTLWDLPGVGTPNYPADKYLEKVGFKKFDFFIIISDCRFRENDVKLAKQIKKMRKNFYFVRSKIDQDLSNEEKSQEDFIAEQTLAKIRENCIQGLQDQGFEAPQVFLVSSFDLHLYDFPLLEETLERELPEHKRNALLWAMPNASPEIIEKKKKAFQDKIKYYAALTAAGAAVPVPGLSIAVDIAVIVGVVTQYVVGFGLDIPSLKRLAKRTGVPLNELFAVIVSPLAAVKVTTELVMKLVVQCSTLAGFAVAEEGTKLIPIIGIPLAMGLSFGTTYTTLKMFLNELAEDAQRVFKMGITAVCRGVPLRGQ